MGHTTENKANSNAYQIAAPYPSFRPPGRLRHENDFQSTTRKLVWFHHPHYMNMPTCCTTFNQLSSHGWILPKRPHHQDTGPQKSKSKHMRAVRQESNPRSI